MENDNLETKTVIDGIFGKEEEEIDVLGKDKTDYMMGERAIVNVDELRSFIDEYSPRGEKFKLESEEQRKYEDILTQAGARFYYLTQIANLSEDYLSSEQKQEKDALMAISQVVSAALSYAGATYQMEVIKAANYHEGRIIN